MPCRCATGASREARACRSRLLETAKSTRPCRPKSGRGQRPALIQGRGDRRQRQDAGPHVDGAFTDLAGLQLEDPLHRVLVEAQQEGQRAVAEEGFSSIMALIGSAKRGSTFGVALADP